MATTTAKKQDKKTNSESRDDVFTSLEFITEKRQSKDIILGFCGFVGCGIKTTITVTTAILESWGYECVHIRLSDIMQDKNYFKEAEIIKNGKNRHLELQELGNKLRRQYGRNEILAEAAIAAIQVKYKEIKSKEAKSKEIDGSEAEDLKIAYLIDQFKRPEEVELFRVIYQSNFYLLGILRDEQERIRNLKEDDAPENKLHDIINIDNKSDDDYGQRTGKAILLSDFFIKNNQSQKSDIEKKINRFIGLIHGQNGLTPSINEKGMYAAYSASLQSACLSRQVGAALCDDEGNLLAVGRNDVPKFGGGLYTYDDQDKDHRCVYKSGKCYNDVNKLKIKKRLRDIINDSITEIVNENSRDLTVVADSVNKAHLDLVKKDILNNILNQSDKIADNLYKESKISVIMEYSRSIHAEMDVITTMARTSKENTKGKVLYTTTYPCHNCARHIVSSGIKKVIYIEPFEKSLALDLHDDAISKSESSKKVSFIEFEGVSPRRYNKFFYPTDERKDDDGVARKFNVKYKNHIDVQYLDSYLTYQIEVSKRFLKSARPDLGRTDI